MKAPASHTKWVETKLHYTAADPECRPSNNCPDLDVLRAAAAAELQIEERCEILDHTLECPYCSESWQLAIQLGARPKPSVLTHVFSVFWQDVGFVLELPGRLKRFLRDGLPSPLLWPAGTAAILTAAGLLTILVANPSFRGGSGQGGSQSAWRGGGPNIESGLDPAASLPRDQVILRWTGPQGASYTVEIRNGEGELLHVAEGLTAEECHVPQSALQSVQPGEALTWTVKASLPHELGTAAHFDLRIE